MSYANKYYPDYKKLYPGVEITPEVLATLRASDRQMRRFEEELKAKGFEVDNEKQTANGTSCPATATSNGGSSERSSEG